MKQIIAAIFCILALQILSVGQSTKQNTESQNLTLNNETLEIKKVLGKWMAARKVHDYAILEQLISDDYKFTTADGSVFNQSQIFSESKLAEIDLPTIAVSDLQVEINGEEAIVTFLAKNDSADKKFDSEMVNRTQKNVQAKWLNWEKQMQRRADLIPNLFEVVKLSGIDEGELWGQVAAARSKLLNGIFDAPKNDSDKSTEQINSVIEANDEFGKTLNIVLVLQENYPQLRSNEVFLKISDELTGVENRLAVARQDYFAAVRYLNNNIDLRDHRIITNWKKINEKWKLTTEREEKMLIGNGRDSFSPI